jgi:hypothetical protein
VTPDCLDEIIGTGRLEPAALAEKRRKKNLIETNQSDQ